MKYIKKVLAAIACVTLLLSMSVNAMAADTTIDFSQTGSITITLKDSAEPHSVIEGSSFQLYQVGTAFSENGTLRVSLTTDFSNSNISLNDLRADGLAAHLSAYAAQQNISGMRANADTNGRVQFNNLQLGLYLAVQDGTVSGYYATEPFLISIPMSNADNTGWLYNIQAAPKAEAKPSSPSTGTTSLSVEKRWVCGDHTAPDAVTIALLCDGKIYDKIVLNTENQWSYQWTKLDKDYSWTAVELDVPDEYQVSYSSSGKTITITNTYIPVLPDNPENLTVKKEWSTAGRAHPESVKVELWDGTNLYATAVLSEGNNWCVTWAQLPQSDEWVIYEVDVPQQYEVSFSVDGTTITILNTDTTTSDGPTTTPTTPSPSNPGGSTLIQTGQLNWPVPVLAVAGVVLFLTGWVIYYRSRKCDEN